MSILVVNYGGSTAHHIQTILTELGIPSLFIQPADPLPSSPIQGIILSGGPDHVYEASARRLPIWIDQINVPVLGICYGMQLIVNNLGGTIVPLPNFGLERGPILINSFQDDPLLGRFMTRLAWMNHFDTVINLPLNLKITSISQNGYISSINDSKRWWGVQFHPENIVGLDWGREIFTNFIQICTNY